MMNIKNYSYMFVIALSFTGPILSMNSEKNEEYKLFWANLQEFDTKTIVSLKELYEAPKVAVFLDFKDNVSLDVVQKELANITVNNNHSLLIHTLYPDELTAEQQNESAELKQMPSFELMIAYVKNLKHLKLAALHLMLSSNVCYECVTNWSHQQIVKQITNFNQAALLIDCSKNTTPKTKIQRILKGKIDGENKFSFIYRVPRDILPYPNMEILGKADSFRNYPASEQLVKGLTTLELSPISNLYLMVRDRITE